MIFQTAKKIILAVINPRKWPTVYERAMPIIKNIVEYHRFSLNPNTKRYWNERFSTLNSFWRNENYYHILDLFPRGKMFSILDVGCALGDGCELLQEKFPEATVTGIDISEVGIEKAKRKTKSVEYLCLDILKGPIPGEYDYITIIETLEHFDNPFHLLDKCLKHAREAVIISVPYKQRLPIASEHRYMFDEKTFAKYRCETVKVSDYVKVTKSKCIIYKITPRKDKTYRAEKRSTIISENAKFLAL